MARKPTVKRDFDPDWYLSEWMQTLHVSQAELGRLTGWSKATVNDVYHGKTSYYRQIVNQVAAALNLLPHELFLTPQDAMAIRNLRRSALSIAAETRNEYTPAPAEITKFG
jgi:transcriptional regulator with XRE-family HTH domain